MEVPDRARKERYYDADFYQIEVELLWPLDGRNTRITQAVNVNPLEMPIVNIGL